MSHHFIRRKIELKKQQSKFDQLDLQNSRSIAEINPEEDLNPEQAPKNDREGYLKIGDIISLQAKEEMTIRKAAILYRGVIFGDGIAYQDLECIPQRLMFSKYQNIQFRQSLFRVEPAHQYGFSKHYQMLLQDPSVSAEELKKYQEKSIEEEKSNEAELELSYGRTITYGERVQLRHLHSNFFLTTSINIAREYGSLKVILVEGGNEGSWIEILPSNKLRQEGEPIRYIDKFILSTRIEKSYYYLHMGISTIYQDDMISELNASDTASLWKALKYISYTEIKKNPSLVSSGDSFRIFNPEHGGYLSVSPRDISDLLPADLDYGGSYNEEKDIECMVFLPKLNSNYSSNRIKKLEVFVEKEKSGRSLWELERTNPFIGGVALAEEFFRIKHVGTGMYLEISRIGNVSLKADPVSIFNVFRFIRISDKSHQIHFDTQLQIKSKGTDFFLGTAESHEAINYLDLHDYDQQEMTPLKSFKEDPTLINTTFVLIDVPELSTIHIYQISRVILKIVEFYSFLNEWGMLKISEMQWIPSYDLAFATEIDLQAQVEKILEILVALNKKILKEHGKDLKSLQTTQETIRETGLLDLLLRLAKLVSNRIKIQNDKKISEKGFFVRGLIEKAVEEIKGPATIAQKYLVGVIKKLFNTIYHCIRTNSKNCEMLKNYNEFLSSQLSYYKVEVSLLLKETFKHSVDIMKKISINQFKVWVEQITTINESKSDIGDQTLILMILSSFCMHKNKGNQRYQRLIKAMIFKNPDRITVFEFATVGSLEYIGFLSGNENFEDFLENNPTIGMLYQESIQNPMTLSRLIQITLINSSKTLVNYVSAFLDLLISLCITRYESGKRKILKFFIITPQYIMSCLRNKDLHLKLRIRFMKLARSLYLDKNGIIPVLKDKDQCNFLDPKLMQFEIKSPFSSPEVNFSIQELSNWLISVWSNSEFPAENRHSYSALSKLKFCIELLTFTKAFINLGYGDFYFFITVYPSLVKLIFDYSNDSLIKFSFDSHWCRSLKIEISCLPVEKVNVMILEVLKIFSIGNHMRKKKEVEGFLDLYTKKLKGELENQEEILKKFVQISKDFYFSEALFINSVERSKKNIAGIALLSVFNKNSPLKFEASIHQSENYQLETCLLSLLFKNSEKIVEERALGLILENFNHRKTLIELLDEIHILYSDSQKSVYMALKYCISALQELFIRLRNKIEFASLKGKFIEDVKEMSFIEGILGYVKQIKSLLMISQPKKNLEFAQGIARNLQYHKIILNFLLKPSFPWIEKQPKRTIISNPDWKRVYKSIIHSLFSFAFKNTKNQKLIYPRLGSISKFFGNGIGTSTLLSQVISCQRESATIERVVGYIFSLFNVNQKIQESPHDLQMLLTLLIDEKKKMQPDIQINVIKALVSSPPIVKYYTRNNSLDFSKYSQGHLKFHTAIVLTLAYCCMNNELAMKQCQQILPYSMVIKELSSPSLNYQLKKAYLHYLVFAFMNSDYGSPNYDSLEYIFSEVILSDLLKYRDYIEYLPSLATKEAYKTIGYHKEIRIEPLASGFLVREYLDDDEIYNNEHPELTKEEKEALFYWKYLISAKPWKIELVTGLLIFIHDISIEMKNANYIPNLQMKINLEKIINIIINIKDTVQEIAEEYPKLNFEFLLDSISISLADIPNNFNNDSELNELNENYCRQIFKELGSLAKTFGLSAQNFVSQKLKISASEVSVKELSIKCKSLISKELSLSDVYNGLRVKGEKISTDVLANEIQKNIKLITFQRAYSICAEVEPIKEVHFNSKLKDFLSGIISKLDMTNSYELLSLVQQIKVSVVDDALKKKDFSNFYKFTRNLELTFSNPDHKVYLMEIFRQMILIERNTSTSDKNEKIKRIQQIQKGLLSVNIAELCLKYLVGDYSNSLIKSSLKMLIQLVEDCEEPIKAKILEDIKENRLGLKLFSFFRDVLNLSLDVINQGISEKLETLDICYDILLLLRLLTCGCYSPFQMYLLEQADFEQRISIDLVSEIVKFVSNMRSIVEIKQYEENKNFIQKVIIEGFEALRSFCQGPCEQVQLTISKHSQIYSTINWIIEDFDENYKGALSFYELVNSISSFLLALLEGDTSESIAITLLNLLNIDKMLKIATEVYWNHIRAFKYEISLENSEFFDKRRNLIVNTGFNISILFIKFQDRFPESDRVKIVFRADSNDVHEKIDDSEAYNYQESILQNLTSAWIKIKGLCDKKKVIDPKLERLNESHFYYTSNIGSVEIQFKSALTKLFFRIPPMCKFLTHKSRKDIAINVSRNSHQEKIEDFFDKSKIYEFEMKHQQSIAQNQYIERIVSYWDFFGFCSFMMVIIINITILVTYDNMNYMSRSGAVNDFLLFCGVLQLLSSFLYLVSYIIEYFPVIRERKILETHFLSHDDIRKYGRVRGTLLMGKFLNLGEKIDRNKIGFGIRFILSDFQLVYCVVYFTISIICWYHFLLYSILLLDLVKRNIMLANILKSISLNYKQILLTLVMGLFIIFIYSTVYFLAFSDQFSLQHYCTSLSVCFFTVLDSGTRAGGGIGDSLSTITFYSTLIDFRIFSDLTFFIVVIIVLLNIIFGIIIDTFAQLRDQRNKLLKDLHENCFVCGKNRFQFETKGISWKLHIHLHHSIHSYLAFLVYIRQKSELSCSGAEIFTKEKIRNNDSIFFPRTALSLIEHEREIREEQNNMRKNYLEKFKALKQAIES